MLFILFIVIYAVALFLAFVFEIKNRKILAEVLKSITRICVIMLAITEIIVCIRYSVKDAELEKNRERYTAIVYKMEHPSSRGEFGLRNKDLVDDIREWNMDYAFYKEMHKSVWFGIFFPDTYKGLGKIDYEKIIK